MNALRRVLHFNLERALLPTCCTSTLRPPPVYAVSSRGTTGRGWSKFSSFDSRRAWLFAGSELAGQRAAVVMSLAQSAKLNGHDPWVYFKDVLTRLPTHMNSRIEELLPHRWQPPR